MFFQQQNISGEVLFRIIEPVTDAHGWTGWYDKARHVWVITAPRRQPQQAREHDGGLSPGQRPMSGATRG